MKIYADPITVNCRKVLAGLKFLDAPYELSHVDYFKSEQQSPEYLAVNPNASLPAMVDDDLTLWESNAILQYAADKHQRSDAYPTDLKTRADVNRWLLWEASAWFPSNYVYLVENCVKPLMEAEADPAVLEGESERFNRLAGILDNRLSQSKWVCGDKPTIADIAIAAPMHLHQFSGIPLQQYGQIRRWMTEQVEQLPAWQDTYVGEGFTLTRP